MPVLRSAFENENVKVVVLEINSGGGSPSEAERITSEIDDSRKNTLSQLFQSLVV